MDFYPFFRLTPQRELEQLASFVLIYSIRDKSNLLGKNFIYLCSPWVHFILLPSCQFSRAERSARFTFVILTSNIRPQGVIGCGTGKVRARVHEGSNDPTLVHVHDNNITICVQLIC